MYVSVYALDAYHFWLWYIFESERQPKPIGDLMLYSEQRRIHDWHEIMKMMIGKTQMNEWQAFRSGNDMFTNHSTKRLNIENGE